MNTDVKRDIRPADINIVATTMIDIPTQVQACKEKNCKILALALIDWLKSGSLIFQQ